MVLFVGSLVSGYLYIRSVKREVNPAIAAVPTSAAAIFETQHFWKDWKKQSSTSLIFKELRAFERFKEYDSAFVFLDSSLAEKEPFRSLQQQSPLLISFIRSGAKDFDLLYTLSIPAEVTPKEILQRLKEQLGKEIEESSKTYDGATITTLTKGTFTGFYCLYKDVLCFSLNQLLIEDAVRQLNSEKSLLEDPSFQAVFETKGKGNQGHWFIQTNEFLDLGFQALQKKPKDKTQDSFSNWMAYDLMVKPNALLLNGFIHCFDSTYQYLNRFEGQSPQEAEVLQYLPPNTAFLYHIGVSDFQSYYGALVQEAEANNRAFGRNKALQNLTDSLGADLIDGFKTLTQNELGVFITEPVLGNIERNSFAFFKSQNIKKSSQLLFQYSTLNDSVILDEEKLWVGKIDYAPLLATIFGEPFSLLKEHYFAAIDNYLIFSNSERSLTDLLYAIESKKTLAKDLNFNTYAEYLSEESNLFMYVNISRSPELLNHFLNTKAGNFFSKNEEVFRQFEGLSLQVSATEKELFYANAYLNHNPGYKQATGTLWELDLDTALARAPYIFMNHYTNAKELFVQDLSHKIYLISNTGKVIWERQLPEPIIGQIYTVDAYKNDKYQLLFNTSTEVYLIDRKGRNVEQFPIQPKAGIRGTLKVLDYDNDKDYRVLIPLKNGEIENRTIFGKPVKGWEYSAKEEEIKQIKFFQQNRKDFITVFYNDGSFSLLNRRGKNRWKLEGSLPVSQNGFFISQREEFKKTSFFASDTLGNIFKLSMNDSREVQTADEFFDQSPTYTYFEVEGPQSGYHVLANSNSFVLLNSEFESIFEQSFPDGKLQRPQVFISPEKNITIALVEKQENRVYLINQFGLISEDYPFKGASPVVIDDLNDDGTQNLVVSTVDGTLLMYSVRQ